MDEQTTNVPQGGGMKEKCKGFKPLWCVAILSTLIIVLTWWWVPTWANIAITVLAGLLIIRSFCPKHFK